MAETLSPDLHLPPEFSGPSQLILYTRYGDPRDAGYEQKWMTTWEVRADFPWFPKDVLYLHKHFQPMLEKALRDLVVMNLYSEIRTFGEDFQIRPIRGSEQVLSLHSWGAAIDLNAEQNPLGSSGSWSPAFIEVMERHHICCGQSWQGRKDPMHFAMLNG